MNKLEIKVEYLSNDKVSHFFEGEIQQSVTQQRPRFFLKLLIRNNLLLKF